LYYFAYGADLDRRQMARCCPQARPCFSAALPNYQLVFTGWSRQWRGGVAAIMRANREKVLGGVYRVAEEDLPRLDRQAGCPSSCDKINLLVFPDTGQPVEAFTYIPRIAGKPASPSADYLKILRQAYVDWGLV
jgi:hypothetical protein